MPDKLTNIGTRGYISASRPATEDVAGYSGLTWIEIKGISTWPGIGPSSEIVSQPDLEDGFTRKAHGAVDGGGGTVQCRIISADPGQLACIDAFENQTNVSFKTVRASGRIEYNYGIVTGAVTNEANSSSVYAMAVTIAVSSKTIYDDAAV